jgi:hypothetical protein
MYRDGPEQLVGGSTETDKVPVQAAPKYETNEQSTGRSFVEIGPDNLEWVGLDTIHLLKQVRQEYDQKDIEALAYSIIKDNEALQAATTPEDISSALQLMHPLTLNRLQSEDATAYLHEHAKFYELEQPEIAQETDGPTVVNIAGHRRYLALEFIVVKLKGMPLQDVRVLAQVHNNLPFPEALALQLRENVKTNPPAQDEAKSIDRFYQYITETTGVKPTYVEVANRIGFRPGKVRDALAFRELPEAIQDYVGLARNGSAVPYSTLVQFKPLQDALRERYDYRHKYVRDEDGNYIKDKDGELKLNPEYSEEARDKDVTNDLHIEANKIAEKRLKRIKAEKIEDDLRKKIRSVQGEVLITAETLFDVEGDNTTSRRLRSSGHLGDQAIFILQLLAKQDQLSERQKKKLEALNGVYSIFDTQAADNQESMF